MMHPSIKRKTVFIGSRPSHLPLRGFRRLRGLGFAPTLPDGTWIQRQPGEPDQKIEGAPPDLSIPYLSQTVSLIADGVYLVPAQPAGSTNFVFQGTNPDAASYSGSQPASQATVLAAEVASTAAGEAEAQRILASQVPPAESPVLATPTSVFGPGTISEVNPALLYPTPYGGSPTTAARAQAAAAPVPASWFDGSTTLLGFTLSNWELTFGGLGLAFLAYSYFGNSTSRKGKR